MRVSKGKPKAPATKTIAIKDVAAVKYSKGQTTDNDDNGNGVYVMCANDNGNGVNVMCTNDNGNGVYVMCNCMCIICMYK